MAVEKEQYMLQKGASMSVAELNNVVVSMRSCMKLAKANLISKMVRRCKYLRSKVVGEEKHKEKNERKIEGYVADIQFLKGQATDLLSKQCLANKLEPLRELSKGSNLEREVRMILLLYSHKKIGSMVKKFRKDHDDWEGLSNFLLSKNSARRFKVAQNVVQKRVAAMNDEFVANAVKSSSDVVNVEVETLEENISEAKRKKSSNVKQEISSAVSCKGEKLSAVKKKRGKAKNAKVCSSGFSEAQYSVDVNVLNNFDSDDNVAEGKDETVSVNSIASDDDSLPSIASDISSDCNAMDSSDESYHSPDLSKYSVLTLKRNTGKDTIPSSVSSSSQISSRADVVGNVHLDSLEGDQLKIEQHAQGCVPSDESSAEEQNVPLSRFFSRPGEPDKSGSESEVEDVQSDSSSSSSSSNARRYSSSGGRKFDKRTSSMRRDGKFFNGRGRGSSRGRGFTNDGKFGFSRGRGGNRGFGKRETKPFELRKERISGFQFGSDKPKPSDSVELHPSWNARRKERQQTSNIHAFSGVRVQFNDD